MMPPPWRLERLRRRKRVACALALAFVLSCCAAMAQTAPGGLDLTAEERAFLRDHPTLRLGVGVAFPPFMEVRREDGGLKFRGMVADYVELLEKKLGVRLEPVLGIPFSRALEMGRDREIDLFPCLAVTPERETFLRYTRPYLTYPLVIVTRDDAPFVGGVEDLGSLRIAIDRNLSVYPLLLKNFPEIPFHIVDVATVPKELEAVSLGRADACVANLAVVAFEVRRQGLGNLKVAAPTPWEDNPLAMAARDDWPILADILQKALDSVTPAEREAIRERWLSLRFEDPFNLREVRRSFALIGLATLGAAALLLTWIVLLKRQINRRRRAERALIEAKAAAEAANTAKSAFLANMSHEIRTPMSAVLGLLHLLERSGLPPRQRDYVRKAQEASQSLLGLLSDILDFSKVEAGRLELERIPLRLDKVLRNLSTILSAPLRDKDVEVLFDVPPGLPKALTGDPLRLQQVLLNLTGNAVKFTERGEVVLRVRVLRQDARGVELGFSIRDTGIGISAPTLERIFDGFTQADPSTARRYGGTGLGLAISRKLVALMGGELVVQSQPGRGSEFSFSAVFATAPESAGQAERESPGAPGAPLRALIVDDNATARQVLLRMAESLGWSAETAENGDEALALLKRRDPSRPACDVIFLDWRMPGINGLELARRIRALEDDPAPPVIILVTAHGRELLAEQLAAPDSPLDGMLVKPVTPSMLFDAVSDARGVPKAAPDAPPPSGSRRLAGLNLLLVEDNRVTRQVVREILLDEGARAETAASGPEALERLARTAAPFDAVLMDLQMPGMDGLETTRLIRDIPGLADLPVIAMTANASPSDRSVCLEAGMNDHLGKPVDVDELAAALRRHCPIRNEGSNVGRDVTAPTGLDRPGFAFDQALRRAASDARLFAAMGRAFEADQRQGVERLRQSLGQGDSREAIVALHDLKGVAATLGATELAEAAAVLETRLRDGETPGPDDPAAGEVFGRFEEACRELARAAGELEAGARRASPGADEAGASGDLEAGLARLEKLLAENNMRAGQVFEELRRDLAAADAALTQALDQAVSRLDYAQALWIVEKIRATRTRRPSPDAPGGREP